MTVPQRILIYAINGKGMGHLNRTLVLAQAARTFMPEVQILFVAASPLFWLVRDCGFPVLKVPDRNNALSFHVGKESRLEHLNGIFELIFEQFRPNAFVVDMTLNVDLFRSAASHGAQVAVVLRKQRSAVLEAARRDAATKYIDRFLIPHPNEEFPQHELPEDWHTRVRRLGPVVRTLQLDQIAETRTKYSRSERPLVVVTIGGGGFAESYRTLTAAEQAAAASMGEIDWVLVYGPYYPHPLPPDQANVRRIRYEPNLLELCASADLVVCNAGYNTIRELVVSGTPAVVIPLQGTGADDQHERATDLAARGEAVVVDEAHGPTVLEQVRQLLKSSRGRRRSPQQGEPAAILGGRFVEALFA
jgi:predicted glycosyltransferase